MDALSSVVYIANNFSIQRKGDFPKEDELENVTGIKLDLRNDMVSYNTNLLTWDWYFNYVKASKEVLIDNDYKATRPVEMLDAGYVPVIYLPIDDTNVNAANSIITKYYGRLQSAVLRCPFADKVIKTNATTMTRKRFDSTLVLDYWVHKLDVCQLIGKAAHEVKSADVIKEVLKYVQ